MEIKIDLTSLPEDGQEVIFQHQEEPGFWHQGIYHNESQCFHGPNNQYKAHEIARWEPTTNFYRPS